ncbi:MAG: hypothetical protein EOM54_03375 [Clostridia bacterium]|nr:hypothetical protein [Clostridia bacterium]
MKKRLLRGYVLGFLSALLLFVFVVPAFALSLSKQITAYYTGIAIYIDGELVEPQDENGNAVSPFICDGTTYLPLRAVAKAVGYDVYYSEILNAAFLTSDEFKEASATPSPTPVVEQFDTVLQSNLLVRVNLCINSANYLKQAAQNAINDLLSRGMGRSSLADEYNETLSLINADLDNLQAIKTDVQNATTNDQLDLYEYEIESYEAVY